MGRDTLKEFRESCPHPEKALADIWEDDYFMGAIWYGKRCTQCGTDLPTPPGPLELGIYR